MQQQQAQQASQMVYPGYAMPGMMPQGMMPGMMPGIPLPGMPPPYGIPMAGIPPAVNGYEDEVGFFLPPSSKKKTHKTNDFFLSVSVFRYERHARDVDMFA